MKSHLTRWSTIAVAVAASGLVPACGGQSAGLPDPRVGQSVTEPVNAPELTSGMDAPKGANAGAAERVGEYSMIPSSGAIANQDPCLSRDNVFVIDGDADEPLHAGAESAEVGVWYSTPVSIHGQTSQWKIDMWAMKDAVLAPGRFEGATSKESGEVILSVSNGKLCPTNYGDVREGWFEIHELETAPDGRLRRLRASFEQRCVGSRAVLRGCVHYAR